jgi:uncharacterized protein (DUF1697 family)
MTTYIGLLRAVNVGGRNKVPMADLRRALEALGLERVQTYIQSGNLLFESAEAPEPIRERIEQAIRDGFGVTTTLVLRTGAAWEQIIAGCPFPADALPEGTRLHVSLLNEAPSQRDAELLSKVPAEPDEYRIHGREIYCLYRQGIVDSRLAKQLAKLKTPATDRNWNTITKLAELAREYQG